MLEFDVVTIFPELFSGFVEASLIGKARRRGLIAINLVNLRDHTRDRHNSVDDTPYGGGSGMVMKPDPILRALRAAQPSRRVLLSPQGGVFDQSTAQRLAGESRILLFCGRYEGVDERVRPEFDEELSLGDYILNGGEVAAMAVIEAVSRLVPEVLGNAHSAVEESFSSGLIEYPQYTRPEIIEGRSVPAILLSGDHGKVAEWRRGQSLMRTELKRPDIFQKLQLSAADRQLLERAKSELANRKSPESDLRRTDEKSE